MAQPPEPRDDAINLDALSQDELGRVPACDADSVVLPPVAARELEEGIGHGRCDTSQRELLRNAFPAE